MFNSKIYIYILIYKKKYNSQLGRMQGGNSKELTLSFFQPESHSQLKLKTPFWEHVPFPQYAILHKSISSPRSSVQIPPSHNYHYIYI